MLPTKVGNNLAYMAEGKAITQECRNYEKVHEIVEGIEPDVASRAERALDGRNDELRLVPVPQAPHRHPGEFCCRLSREGNQPVAVVGRRHESHHPLPPVAVLSQETMPSGGQSIVPPCSSVAQLSTIARDRMPSGTHMLQDRHRGHRLSLAVALPRAHRSGPSPRPSLALQPSWSQRAHHLSRETAGRATCVPHRTDNLGTQRTTTVNHGHSRVAHELAGFTR